MWGVCVGGLWTCGLCPWGLCPCPPPVPCNRRPFEGVGVWPSSAPATTPQSASATANAIIICSGDEASRQKQISSKSEE